MSKFSEQIKATRAQGGEARVKAAETFVTPPAAVDEPVKADEPRRQLNIRIPESVYEEIRRKNYETRIPMQDLIVDAWRRAHPAE
ncbi:hypothetical protein HQ602_17425 [Rhodococcus kroppenstedtii]|uniref:hypothetical protein n=1 Tax=Rhodococcoides kroppenstedtii TaxID=293050 RepID=UPI001C9ABF0A|nr:hypothetical protein [Rhodococcus kroppenstedtii]MBY6438156.1 hypothetical protein [Rhodococcus kroppenstedtii]